MGDLGLLLTFFSLTYWVVTRLGNLTVPQGCRTHTLTTVLMGLTPIIFIWLLGRLV